MTRSHASSMVLVSGVLAFGCVDHATDPPSLESVVTATQQDLLLLREGELIGDVFIGGEQDTSSNLYLYLSPYDAETSAHIREPFGDQLWLDQPDATSAWMIEYFDPRGGSDCGGSLNAYWTGGTEARDDERHEPGPGQSASGPEEHCIVPGVYELTVVRGQDTLKSLIVDYPQIGGETLHGGTREAVEAVDYYSIEGEFVDLRFHHDQTSGQYSETSSLDVENSGSNPYKSTYANQPSPEGTVRDWFRFSILGSGSGWDVGDVQGDALARLFWNTQNPTDENRTGFYNVHAEDLTLIRLHKFAEASGLPKTLTVGLEIMRPDQQPGDGTAEVSLTRSVLIQPSLIAEYTEESTSTWRYVDQFLDASPSSTGPNIVYRWKFESSGQWTPYSPNPVYEFPGHTSAGSNKTVTLEVKDQATADTALLAKSFSVTSSVVTLSGATYVTDKKLKTYTSNYAGSWFERMNPDTNMDWGTARLTGASTYNRIWPAGWYDVALRNHVDFTPLKRRRLDIEVCWKCSPEMERSTGSASADRGIFGAGPWISAGSQSSPELVRFYDLTGQHEPGSPFADVSWMSEKGGEATDAAGRWRVEWSRLEVPDPNIEGYEFRVTPLAGAAYEFAMAIDPDLEDPTDDESGFDSGRGMIYAVDESNALGFLLLDSRGDDALLKANQFGARKFAPGAKEEAWKAQREPGVKLEAGADDVQLILSTAETSGVQSWTLWMLRGDSVQDIRKLADQVREEY